ncbi:MAG: hypothetical protein ACXADH_07725 [Candidatus Kariarchaeaceae archaeon]|jgi:hypothetical protein
MEVWSNLKAHEEKTRNIVLKDHLEIIILLKEAFAHYTFGITKLPKLGTENVPLIRVGLITENHNFLRLSIFAATRGYYLQSISLLRNVYQNWLAFWYLIQFPDDAHFWVDPSWEKRPPNSDTMRRKMEHPSKDSSQKIHELATELHRFAHTDPVVILNQLQVKDARVTIHVGPNYVKEIFFACSYALSFWIGNMLDAVDSLILDEAEWEETHCNLRNRILKHMEEYNSQFVDP